MTNATRTARKIANETLRASHKITMAQLVKAQKAARAALREEQRIARAQQMADQKAARAALRAEYATDRANLAACFAPPADVEESWEDFEVEIPAAPEMPPALTAALGRLNEELAA